MTIENFYIYYLNKNSAGVFQLWISSLKFEKQQDDIINNFHNQKKIISRLSELRPRPRPTLAYRAEYLCMNRLQVYRQVIRLLVGESPSSTEKTDIAQYQFGIIPNCLYQ